MKTFAAACCSFLLAATAHAALDAGAKAPMFTAPAALAGSFWFVCKPVSPAAAIPTPPRKLHALPQACWGSSSAPSPATKICVPLHSTR